MRILTVGASPYLLTKLGKMNNDVLCVLKEQEHDIASAVWHLDPSWFTPDNNGIYYFEHDNKNICRLFPFMHLSEQSSTQLYEIMKSFQPDIVISIGDYHEMTCVAPVKSMYPQLFSWISVFTIDALPINENMREIFEHVDYALTTTKMGHKAVSDIVHGDCEYLPYGPDHSIFYPLSKEKKDKELTVISSEKNCQSTNIACFIKAISNTCSGVRSYLHTNLYDLGDYDIHLLIDRFKATEKVQLPNRFVGLNDGYMPNELNEKYNLADVVVDVSVRSATGLTVLEAMSTGCIPVCTKVGALSEIVEMMPKEFQYFVPSYEYIGEKEESFFVASVEGLTCIINELYEMKINRPDDFMEASNKSIEISSRFSKENFVKRVIGIIKERKGQKSKVSIETL